MMRMIHSLLAAAAAIAAPLAAQTPPAPAPAEAVKPAIPAPAPAPAVATIDADPALWVVRDADTTIYMLGTVHVLKPGLSWFDEAVRKAFDDSQEVVLEIVMPEDPNAIASVMVPRAMAAPGGVPLTQKLPEAARPKYAAALQSAGIPPAQFDRFKPWFVSTTLVMLPLAKLGYNPESGVEKQITAAAKAAGKPVTGLETIEQQLGFFDQLSEKAQVDMLVATVDDYAEVGPTLDRMVSTWSRGDADALAREMNDQMKDQPEVARTLLYDRNARWADWIRTRLDKPGTVFMAVGAGHLAGPRSVQDALKARGLKTTRIAY